MNGNLWNRKVFCLNGIFHLMLKKKKILNVSSYLVQAARGRANAHELPVHCFFHYIKLVQIQTFISELTYQPCRKIAHFMYIGKVNLFFCISVFRAMKQDKGEKICHLVCRHITRNIMFLNELSTNFPLQLICLIYLCNYLFIYSNIFIECQFWSRDCAKHLGYRDDYHFI